MSRGSTKEYEKLNTNDTNITYNSNIKIYSFFFEVFVLFVKFVVNFFGFTDELS